MIEEVKSQTLLDRRLFTNSFIKEWCAKRWRNLFIQEALQDSRAVYKASKKGKNRKKDSRSPRKIISDRYIMGLAVNRELELEMPEAQIGKVKNTTLIFCPGFVNGFFPTRAYETKFTALSQEYGVNIIRADSHPMRSSEANMDDLLRAINHGVGFAADSSPISPENATPPGDIFLIGYSKGVTDLLTMIAHYPELKKRIRCIFSIAGAIGGSHVASNWHRAIREVDLEQVEVLLRILLPMILPGAAIKSPLRRLDEYDTRGALGSMKIKNRAEFLELHRESIDELNIPFFQITASTKAKNVPLLNKANFLDLWRIDADNDSELTANHQKLPVPMATNLATVQAHHVEIAYEPLPKEKRKGAPNMDYPFPRKALITAIFKFAAETGLID